MVSNCINKLSKHLFARSYSSQDVKDTPSSHVCKSALRLLLSVINHLRTQDPGMCFSNRKKITNWERNLWLDLDYLQVAKAAFSCGSHFSAILFAEIACNILEDDNALKLEGTDNEVNSKVELQKRQLPPLQRVSDSPSGKDISTILLQVYNALGESDGVEGCSGANFATNSIIQSTLSMHRGNWMQSLAVSDAGKSVDCLIDGLQTTGMYNVLHSLSTSAGIKTNKKVLEAQAECAWRLGKWDGIEKNELRGFHQIFLKASTDLKDKNLSGITETLDIFKNSTIAFLKENGNESTSSIYPMLAQLQVFSEFYEIAQCLTSSSSEEISNRILSLESSWEEKENYGKMESDKKELILSARISSLKILSTVCRSANLQPVLFKSLINKCKLAHSGKVPNISEFQTAILEAQAIASSAEERWQLKLQQVHFVNCLNNQAQAIGTLEELLKDIKSNDAKSQRKIKEHCNTLMLYGQVLMKSRTRSPKVIINNYFLEAIGIMEENLDGCCESLKDSYHELAEFGDSLYQEVNSHLSSDYLKIRLKQIEKSGNELQVFRQAFIHAKTVEEKKNYNRQCSVIDRDMKREQEDIANKRAEATEFLNLALKNYLKSLVCSSVNNLNVFRVVALWFENLVSKEANELVAHYGPKMKSHQFIPLLYQLVARLTGIEDSIKHHSSFPKILSSTLYRVCVEHPHHGLPVILMLAHSHLDEEILEETSSRRSKLTKKEQQNSIIEEDRVQAAKLLVNHFKKNSKLAGHIAEIESVCTAYIILANKDRKNLSGKLQIPSNPLMKIKNLKYMAPLTRSIAVQPSLNYGPPLICKWDQTVTFVGGINNPMKLTIHSSDGLQSNELLKSNDDLRQDAVLEQVFSVVNELLNKDGDAVKQNLCLKTYLVVPLSQKSGIIQWCDNTKVFDSYITEAHKKHYPHEPNADRCRAIFKNAAGSPVTEKVKTLESILKNLHPVFRFFFYEEYPQPEKWFIQRQAYTRSVATSSIAGYILGLGDRHVRNLLLDVKTAEIVHIDLGIAFENGKLLPTPERVPFRMTQNIIDGFGVMGIEGPLRKSMETTMRVLREAKSVLITIVEVLRHDPLHQWTLSSKQILKLQQSGSQDQFVYINTESNSVSMAERALVRVTQKLNGLQDGLVLSVPEHVSVLLQHATDINNLSQMFAGWQPYL